MGTDEELSVSAGHCAGPEIGFWKGGTALGFDKEITGGRITSIDFWAVAEDTAAFLTGNSAFRNHFEFINGHSHRAPTIEAAEKQAPYDMLFIDGGHTYDDVKQDYVNYSGFVRKEGMIVFHDIRLETDPVTGKEGVKRAYWELAEGNFHSELIAPYPDDLPRKEGFGIGIIYKSW